MKWLRMDTNPQISVDKATIIIVTMPSVNIFLSSKMKWIVATDTVIMD